MRRGRKPQKTDDAEAKKMAPLCKGSWHGEAVTEGLTSAVGFCFSRKKNSPAQDSASRLCRNCRWGALFSVRRKLEEHSLIPDSGSVGWTLAEAEGAAATLQSRFARQLPLHRGAFDAGFALPFCWTRAETERNGRPRGPPVGFHRGGFYFLVPRRENRP